MKIKLAIVLFSLTLLLFSCNPFVKYYIYVHKPTVSIKDCLWNSGYKKAKCFKGEEFIIIPNFRTFTPSFGSISSHISFFSKSNEPVWISKAILRVKGEETETTLNLSGEYPYKKTFPELGYYDAIAFLFDEKNTDLSKYSMKDTLELELHYSPSRLEPVKVEFFQFKLKKEYNIAWPT